MRYDAESQLLLVPERASPQSSRGPAGGAPVSAPLPVGLVVTERFVAAFRSHLQAHDLGDYLIFHCGNLDLHDIEQHLPALGEVAAWDPAPAFTRGGEPLATMTHGDGWAKVWDGGFLTLARHEAVVARWHWMGGDGSTYHNLYLFAAPTVGHYRRLHDEVLKLRHDKGGRVWQIVRGEAWNDGDPIPRDATAGDDLVLSPSLRQRVEADVLRFFAPEVAALYRSMRVPYRRGVLLHGPPGNGKTSLIRRVGAALPDVPCLLLRPHAGFDTDDFETIVGRWRDQAPAVLVIEDLDWLLGEINVSTFLNLLDGVESGPAADRGLLLIATTNNPDKLDPAVNNRPGRFDVVVDVPPPDRALRIAFLSARLDGFDGPAVERVADATGRLSFAHLQEVVRLSGLMAIHAGRTARTMDDLLAAADTVRGGHDDATKGFPTKLETPFGLQHLVGRKG